MLEGTVVNVSEHGYSGGGGGSGGGMFGAFGRRGGCTSSLSLSVPSGGESLVEQLAELRRTDADADPDVLDPAARESTLVDTTNVLFIVAGAL